MTRHAYLIMCHNNFDVLEKLVSALDDPRNDIYIHIDKKVRNIAKIRHRLHVFHATLTFTKRIRVSWGGFSQIQAELILLQEAVKKEHAYYHLISGVDMPLKNQDYIHAFFAANQGKEFISIDDKSENGALFAARIMHYHFLQDFIGRNQGLHIAVAYKIEQFLLKAQSLLKINRLCNFSGYVYKGGNWFSITHDMAEYILRCKKQINNFRFGLCADELFLQTIAMTSPYSENITGNILRYVDWKRGNPYTFRGDDFELLITSDKLFARKFDEKIDIDIVYRIYEHLMVTNESVTI